ncbi:MAG: hypothetical protein ACXVJG_03685 [Mucilaginibacter sp.]
MTLTDIKILGKKIGIGLVVAIVPLILIVGGLWLTKTVLDKSKSARSLNVK